MPSTVIVLTDSEFESMLIECGAEAVVVRAYMDSKESQNDSYFRVYCEPNKICPSPLDTYTKKLTDKLGVVGAYKYILVHVSW